MPVIAALLAGGFLAGGALKGEERQAPVPTATAVTTRHLSLVRPATWRSLRPAPQVPGLAAERVALAPSGATADVKLVAGVAPPGADGVLPDDLLARLPGRRAAGDPVRLGRLEALQYSLRPEGTSPFTLYAVPTETGTAMVACLDARRSGAAACGQVASTLRLRDLQPVGVQPAPAYAAAMTKAFERLAAERSDRLRELAAARLRRGQARAAAGLAGEYRRAADAVQRAPDQRFVAEETDAVATRLRAAGKAYASLSRAAGRGDEAGYRAARTAVLAADRAVSQALRALERAGYAVR